MIAPLVPALARVPDACPAVAELHRDDICREYRSLCEQRDPQEIAEIQVH